MAKENFVGRAGQLAVMAEFLLRGYNVAIPEVDVGDDVLVVSDPVEQLWRVQVKTALAVGRSYGYSGRYQVPLVQLQTPGPVPLYYAFVLRREAVWDFVILPREFLQEEHQAFEVGSSTQESLVLHLAFRTAGVTCSGRDWQAYRNNWSAWPVMPSS
jgi:hypothetical protein